jgi:hypothetical protein
VFSVPSFLLSSIAVRKLLKTPSHSSSSKSRSKSISSIIPQLGTRYREGMEGSLALENQKSIDVASEYIASPDTAYGLLDKTSPISPIRFEKPRYHYPFAGAHLSNEYDAPSMLTNVPEFSAVSGKSSTISPTSVISGSLAHIDSHPVDTFHFKNQVEVRDHDNREGKTASSVAQTTVYPPRESTDSDIYRPKPDYPWAGDVEAHELEGSVQVHGLHSKRGSQPLNNSEVVRYVS